MPHIESPLSETALLEAMDHLDTAWRLTFGKKKRLLSWPTGRSVADLASTCSTREDFNPRLSILDDIMKRMSIPDELIPPEVQDAIQPAEAFKRLSGALAGSLEVESRADLESAIETLSAINRL